ncbi:hypothetical protein B6V73_07865 [Thioclava sp. JM3]|uniref:DUF177 domain-containing protein n=1 Tax=Thioclava nitratireducens TaxID=1915078 RepID=A0ABM6IIV5_9RHOB|nr:MULTISPECIES: DUF177 domain-containing protein [Thioclava]AQS48667.1 hypothetical protein BMG03_13350 [Thioclava nitratireducens]OWY07473.1 hypothetical protein B6V74_18155 [Thioclava sp. F42-5]OWY12077.1 hypothetical protein B6V72_13225 [Thioclava sp. F34-6]OWY17565.1 hypothetical protein B6V73_07865 [Thioclava sp. JM3]PWE49214.1 DUF177 domain-containing protein [Thioclava sp. NG1]
MTQTPVDPDLPAAPETIWSEPMRLADLPSRKPTRFDIEAKGERLQAIADWADIRGVEALRLKGELAPKGRSDWELRATLEARVVQDCVITLAPVTTDIREEVVRRYLADMEMPTSEEVEMPEDDTAEPLPATVNLGVVALEAMELALPLYPRAEGAELEGAQVTEPGAEPLSDEQMKPFANLRDLLAKGESGKGDA